jgi:hypothetical protein
MFVSLVFLLIFRYEMSVLLIQMICICGYYPMLSVTSSHTDSISMYIFCMKKKYESRILMSLSFVDVSGGIQIGHP